MNNITIEDLINLVSTYNKKDLDKIRFSYEYASYLHKGQLRASGEEYIIHPLNVSYILAELQADTDTLIAAMLHDTLEDTSVEKEEIRQLFGDVVLNLVEGVTKISKVKFSNANDANLANTRKIIMGMTKNIRIIIIKLADRLHNMRTLEFKRREKQLENAYETLNLYVPVARALGLYKIKNELEDLSFKYIEPDSYQEISDLMAQKQEQFNVSIDRLFPTIKGMANDVSTPNEIKIRLKHLYGIYKALQLNGCKKIDDIHDLLAIKIVVLEIGDCYSLLEKINHEFKPIKEEFKDYIKSPKPNMYQSLQTSVYALDNEIIQLQIRNFEMDQIASFGVAAFWKYPIDMEEEVHSYQFYKSLCEIDDAFKDNYEFMVHTKSELLDDKIRVIPIKGQSVELPVGSTLIDYVYSLDIDSANHLVCAYVNGKAVPFDYVLKHEDKVEIVTDPKVISPSKEWLESVSTTFARQKIRKSLKI